MLTSKNWRRQVRQGKLLKLKQMYIFLRVYKQSYHFDRTYHIWRHVITKCEKDDSIEEAEIGHDTPVKI